MSDKTTIVSIPTTIRIAYFINIACILVALILYYISIKGPLFTLVLWYFPIFFISSISLLVINYDKIKLFKNDALILLITLYLIINLTGISYYRDFLSHIEKIGYQVSIPFTDILLKLN